ncbi:MAG: hypothetical protein IPP40_04040 [bacterium]|nr:hypothetical protein [bacterium]
MKKVLCILAALLMVIVSGCGLVSGTAFVSQKIDGRLKQAQRELGLGGNTLDDQMEGVLVDLTDNSDWSDFTIEGVEDGCVNMMQQICLRLRFLARFGLSWIPVQS